jgi:hypothetical protein
MWTLSARSTICAVLALKAGSEVAKIAHKAQMTTHLKYRLSFLKPLLYCFKINLHLKAIA